VHGPLLNLALYCTLIGFVWDVDAYVKVQVNVAVAPDVSTQS